MNTKDYIKMLQIENHKLEQENQQLKTIIEELEKWLKSFTTEEFNYNFLVVRVKDILEKINKLKGENDERNNN